MDIHVVKRTNGILGYFLEKLLPSLKLFEFKSKMKRVLKVDTLEIMYLKFGPNGKFVSKEDTMGKIANDGVDALFLIDVSQKDEKAEMEELMGAYKEAISTRILEDISKKEESGKTDEEAIPANSISMVSEAKTNEGTKDLKSNKRKKKKTSKISINGALKPLETIQSTLSTLTSNSQLNHEFPNGDKQNKGRKENYQIHKDNNLNDQVEEAELPLWAKKFLHLFKKEMTDLKVFLKKEIDEMKTMKG